MKTYVLLKNGFEEVEALTVVDYLRRADISVKTVSMEIDLEVTGSHQIKILADMLFENLDFEEVELLFIPGGMPAAEDLSNDAKVIELVKYLDKIGRALASICAGPIVFGKSDIIKDKKITSYPSFEEKIPNLGEYGEDLVVVCENVITSRGPATAVLLALELIELIKGNRIRNQVEKDILLDLVRGKIC